jgi:predicted AAA+ superfamily ATPase
MHAYERPLVRRIEHALATGPNLIHIVTGPRQVGKTTLATTIAERWSSGPVRFAAADEMLPPTGEWLQTQWQLARRDARDGVCLLVLDEVQKIPSWSDIVKGLWDADRRTRARVKVLLLGSSALPLAQGTSESLTGRFLLHPCVHWGFSECKTAFGWDLDQWLFYGGYPGAALFAHDLKMWRTYVRDALIEPALARDVLSLQRVTKPALLRHLFAFACHFPAQAVSYNKMLGQLQDAGNTTTLAHYLDLLESAYLVTGLERFSGNVVRSRGSTPKLISWNNALINALDLRSFEEAREDRAFWGRLIENAVGAHLLNHLPRPTYAVSWWREGNDEVDFVVQGGKKMWAIEVKSGRSGSTSGLQVFRRGHPDAKSLLIGTGGMPLEEFFAADPDDVLR